MSRHQHLPDYHKFSHTEFTLRCGVCFDGKAVFIDLTFSFLTALKPDIIQSPKFVDSHFGFQRAGMLRLGTFLGMLNILVNFYSIFLALLEVYSSPFGPRSQNSITEGLNWSNIATWKLKVFYSFPVNSKQKTRALRDWEEPFLGTKRQNKYN